MINKEDSTSITLDYYNTQANAYTKDTLNVQFSEFQQDFLAFIPNGGYVLDLGCGSGRDSKAFVAAGYQVTAVDGSAELCKIASNNIGQPVIHSTFQDYHPKQKFDGIWACASLLHLKHTDIQDVIARLANDLKENGCFYASFKYGDYTGLRNGRYFTDFTEKSFSELVENIQNITIEKTKITSDVRPGRDQEKWLNVFMVRR